MSLAALLLLLRTVSYTTPAFLADTAATGNGCLGGPLPALERQSMRLYGAPAYHAGWVPVLLRVHADLMPGTRDTFNLYDAEPWSYWVAAANSVGEGCTGAPGSGITVGVPSVSVPPSGLPARRELFDLAGRRVEGTPRSGVYFELTPGTKTKRIVVIR
jgi:hypothetical protein